MADISKLEEDVRWWTEEIRNINNKISQLNLELRNAARKLEDRQRELTQAHQDQARDATKETV